jgi:cyclase
MIRAVREITHVPLIASGGAGELADFSQALAAGADAVLAASVFHFQTFTIAQVKDDLAFHGYAVRR